jgi:cell division protease FtsH
MFGQGVEGKEYSETTSALIDAEVKRIMTEATERARDVLTDRRAVLDAIAQKLIEVETLEQPEYEALISSHGIPLKKIES